MPAIGERVPDFVLSNQDGKAVRLSDFRGKRVLIFAYPKAGTSGCTTQACGLRDAFPRFENANMVILGLSPDQPDALRQWKEIESLPYDLLSDPDHQVIETWGAWGEKSMYGKKYMGVIRSHWIIDEQGIVVDAQVSISPAKSVELATQYATQNG